MFVSTTLADNQTTEGALEQQADDEDSDHHHSGLHSKKKKKKNFNRSKRWERFFGSWNLFVIYACAVFTRNASAT